MHKIVCEMNSKHRCVLHSSVSRLGQFVHNHPNYIMFPLGEGKTKYEIHSNVIPLPLGNWKGIQ